MAAVDRATAKLESWKAVAAYFGRDERTVRRWEAERGLPVRRLPGGGRSRVYAEVDELEAWRRGDETNPVAQAPALPAPKRSFNVRRTLFVVLAAVLVIALGMLAIIGQRQPETALETTSPPLAAQRLYLEGDDAWAQRTPESLNKALDDFNAAIAIYPRYAEAYVGLAETFDLLREYTLMPDAQAYPLARGAARHALALNPDLSDAHAALAFSDYWGFWDAAGARAEFQRAIALDPRSVTAHHWYATFLDAVGDSDGALKEIALARTLDPTSRSIRADGAELLAHAGRVADGIAILEGVEKANPTFSSPHVYLANLYLETGRDDAYLRESARLAALTGDPKGLSEVAAARRAYLSGGRVGMLHALLQARMARAEAGDASAYSVAKLCILLGDKPRALAWLRHALTRREAALAALPADSYFRALHGDPDFQAVLARIAPA